MKRKLKDFLNKRVISGTLSAAIAFNMAAYLPISVFAHDDSPTESTVDLKIKSFNKQNDDSCNTLDKNNHHFIKARILF